ncbi:MAG: diacylglycerol kinase family lipid kinase [Gemmatimonadota bacterium]
MSQQERRHAHVILNPVSGGGRGRKARERIEKGLTASGLRFDLSETQAQGHAFQLARERAFDADVVVAVGGDGTAHEVANGLLTAARQENRASAALAVLPVGSGNDFVKMLGLHGGLSGAITTVANGAVRYFDVGRVTWDGGDEFFINGAGTGIDVEVVRQVLRTPRLPGLLKYLVGVLRAVVRFRAIPLRVTVDGESFDGRMMMVAVGNGKCIGGGFWVTPDAEPEDALLDILMVDNLNYREIAAVIPKVMRGTHTGVRQVTMRRGREIRIEATGDAPLFFQLDGELREPPNARMMEISTLPGALSVLVGAGAPSDAPGKGVG